MIDSSGRLPIGIIDGTLSAHGDLDQCIDIQVKDEHQLSFVGQYCTVKLTLPLPLDSMNYSNKSSYLRAMTAFRFQTNPSIYNGICLPSTCSPKDIQTLLKESK